MSAPEIGEATINIPLTGLSEELSTAPTLEVIPEPEKAGFFRSIRNDVAESDHKAKTIAAGLSMGVSEVIGIAHIQTAAAAFSTVELVERTGSVPVASGGTIAAYGTIALGRTWLMSTGVRHFPRATEAVGRKLPWLVGNVSDALPGIDAAKPPEDVKRANVARRAGGFVFRHAKRGLVAFGVGTAPHIVAAGINQPDAEKRLIEQRKLTKVLSADATAVAGALSLAAASVMQNMSEHNPAGYEAVHNAATDPKLWLQIGALTMVGEWLKNKWVNRRANPVSEP